MTDLSETKCLKIALPPSSKTRLKKFMGMVEFYWRLVSKYAALAALSVKFLKNEYGEMLQLDAAALKTHYDFNSRVTLKPVLALPRKAGAYVLDTDASAAQLNVQFLQERLDDSYRQVGF